MSLRLVELGKVAVVLVVDAAVWPADTEMPSLVAGDDCPSAIDGEKLRVASVVGVGVVSLF